MSIVKYGELFIIRFSSSYHMNKSVAPAPDVTWWETTLTHQQRAGHTHISVIGGFLNFICVFDFYVFFKEIIIFTDCHDFCAHFGSL